MNDRHTAALQNLSLHNVNDVLLYKGLITAAEHSKMVQKITTACPAPEVASKIHR